MKALQVAAAELADSLRATLDSVFASPVYRWETREDPLGLVRRAWLWIGDTLTSLRDRNPGAVRLLTWVLVAILIALLMHAAWVAIQTVRGASRRLQSDPVGPTSTPRDARWYADESMRLADAGNFAAAMQADFLRLMLELDAARVTTYHPSKTPSEYARDAVLTDDGRRALRLLISDMYAYAFARIPLDRALYDRWRVSAVADRYARAH